MKIAHLVGATVSRQLKQFSGDGQLPWQSSTKHWSLQSVTWSEVVAGQLTGGFFVVDDLCQQSGIR